MPTKPMAPEVRIQRATQTDEAGCWNWMLSKDRIGYGRMKVQLGSRERFRFTSAHRYAYEVFIGEIPDGMYVLHKCDNRACCNPDHLFLGTQQDNMLDMWRKGRGPRGYKRNPTVCAENARKKRSHRNQYSAAMQAQKDSEALDDAIDAAMDLTRPAEES